MKKIIVLLFCMPLMWLACSSDSSSNSANAEGNAALTETSSSSTENEGVLSSSVVERNTPASYGVVPIDTAFVARNPQSINGDNGNITSSSKTVFRFNTERTVLYENWGDRVSEFVAAYYDELGVQFSGSDYNAGYMVTYRTLSDESRNYAAWLWSNSYSQKTCESDYELFESVCSSHNGEFVNYREGNVCATNQLWLSCVYPLDVEVNKAFIDSVATEIHSFVSEHWSTPYPKNEPSSSMSASSTSP